MARRSYGCALLAGGEGKRFGFQNKADLTIDNETFLSRISRRMRETGLPCYLSTAAYQQEVPEGFREVRDTAADRSGNHAGPMGGICSCLTQAEKDGLDGLFFIPCDAPDFCPEMILRLQESIRSEDDAVLWQTPDGKLQPVFGYYSVRCLPVLEKEISAGCYKLRKFLDKVKTHVVYTESRGIPADCFTNINTAADYRSLRSAPPAASAVLSLEEAVRFLREQAGEIRETKILKLREALGFTLAQDIHASIDQPPFPRSPFDGYAVRAEDTRGACAEHPAVLTVIGEVDAGEWFERPVSAGEAVRIMTGAPIPAGTDAVIKQEETDYGETTVRIRREMSVHKNYIFPGEDYKKGTLLLKKGEYLGAVEIGILASTGITEVPVFRKPKALVISTGDEVVLPGEDLSPGKIYDSSLYTLSLQLEAWGCEVPGIFHSPDDPRSCIRLIEEWAGKVDFIVTTGGVSVGKKDIMHEVYALLDIRRIFWKVGIKPGAAMMAGKFRDSLILSLSGNPYAAYVNLHMLVREVLSGLTHNPALTMIRQKAVLTGDYDRESPIRRFVRCYVQDQKVYVEGHTGGNGDIASSRHINALIDLPAGSGKKKAGDEVTVLLL